MKNEDLLVVRVKLKVTIDRKAYREAYGKEPDHEIRRAVRHGAAGGLDASIAAGIRDIEIVN